MFRPLLTFLTLFAVIASCFSQISDWAYSGTTPVNSVVGIKRGTNGVVMVENQVGGSPVITDFNVDGTIQNQIQIPRSQTVADFVVRDDGSVVLLSTFQASDVEITVLTADRSDFDYLLTESGVAGSILDLGANKFAISVFVDDFTEKVKIYSAAGTSFTFHHEYGVVTDALGFAPNIALSDDQTKLVSIGSNQLNYLNLGTLARSSLALPVGARISLLDLEGANIWAVGAEAVLDPGDWRVYRWNLNSLVFNGSTRVRGVSNSLDVPRGLAANDGVATVVGDAGNDGMRVKIDQTGAVTDKRIDAQVSWRAIDPYVPGGAYFLGGMSTGGSADRWIIQEEGIADGIKRWGVQSLAPGGTAISNLLGLTAFDGGILVAGVGEAGNDQVPVLQRFFRVRAIPQASPSDPGTTINWTIFFSGELYRDLALELSATNGAVVQPNLNVPMGTLGIQVPMTLPSPSAPTICRLLINGIDMEWNPSVAVNPLKIASVGINPTTVFSGGSVIATIGLNGPAPVGGTSIVLADNSGLATTPASVLIPEGETSAPVNITTFVSRIDQTITVTAYLNGSTKNASFDLKRSTLQTVEIGPASVIGGVSANALVKVNGLAAESNIVTLSSSNLAAATVPSQVVIVKGQYQAAFNVTTKGVKTDTLVTITGSMNSVTATDTITVKAAKLISLSFPATVPGGSTATGTLLCDGIMPPGGTPNTVALSDNSASLTTPTSATIPVLNTGTSFTVSALAVAANTNATVSATFRGVTKTATITIQRAAIESVSLSAEAVSGGTPVTITVRLTAAAPSGGAPVTLQSTNAALLSVPATVTVPSGLKSFSFVRNAGATGSIQTVTISAIRFGTKTTTLTVVP